VSNTLLPSHSQDREDKFTQLFTSIKLNGAKLKSLNGHDIEVAVRNMAQGAAWADDLAKVLKSMMHPAAANETKSKESAEMKEIARGGHSGGISLPGWSHIAPRNKRREDDEDSMRSSSTMASKAFTIYSTGERDAGSEAIVDWFGKQLLDLINNKGDDADELKRMLDDFARKEITDDIATWWIGPWKLSEWHIKPAHSKGKSKPSTLLALAAKAKPIRLNIVKSLVNDYKCSVTVTQKVNGKDIGVTALHEAAYCGHAAVVDFLLEAGANYNQESTLWDDKFPLDSAKSGSKIHENDPKKVEQYNLIIAALTSLKAKETGK